MYGSAVAVHARDTGKFQHQGYGSLLMQEAERIALHEHRSSKMAVISGVGTRHYYRKLGYELEGPYIVKNLCGSSVVSASAANIGASGASVTNFAAGAATQHTAGADVIANVAATGVLGGGSTIGGQSRGRSGAICQQQSRRVSRRRWTQPAGTAVTATC